MSVMASHITGVSIVYSAVCSGADQRKHQSSTSLAFVWGFHQWPVDSPHKGASNTENVSIWWCHHAVWTKWLLVCRCSWLKISVFDSEVHSVWPSTYDLVGNKLTHSGLVTPYGDRDLGQHWLRYWLVAWRHQAITWANVDLSSVRASGIHLSANSQEIPQPPITEISLKIIYVKFQANLPGANGLTMVQVMIWRWTGDRSYNIDMILTQIPYSVIWAQWIKHMNMKYITKYWSRTFLLNIRLVQIIISIIQRIYCFLE